MNMRGWTARTWLLIVLAAAASGSLLTAYMMQRWWGVVLVLAAAAALALLAGYLWRRSKRLRGRLKDAVRAPVKWSGQHPGRLALLGAGSISLVGLYSLLGGDAEARAAVEHLAPTRGELLNDPEAVSVDAGQWESVSQNMSLDAALEGFEGISWVEEESLAEGLLEPGAQESPEDLAGDRVVGSYGAVIPVFLLVSGLRSLWKRRGQMAEGHMTAKEALHAAGIDMVGSAGRIALFAGGAQAAGLLVGGVPVIVASGLLANMAGEPLLRRMQAWLRGDQGQLAQYNVRQRLEALGRSFDKQQLLPHALLNLERFVENAQSRQWVPKPPASSLRQQFFPSLADVLDEELYQLRIKQRQELDEFAEGLRNRLRDTMMRGDYCALGELLYLNRQVLLPGMENQVQKPLSQLDKALQRLGQNRADLRQAEPQEG